MSAISSLGRSLLFVVSGFLTLAALPLALWLLFNFETTSGFLIALLGICAPAGGLLLYYGLKRSSAQLLRLSTAAGGVSVFLLIFIAILAPSGSPITNSPVRHMYSNGGRFVRLSPLNLIPEIEQMNVGTNLVGPADPFIDRAKADRLATMTLDIYAEMEADPDFKALGSAMGIPLREPLGIPFDNGHYYLYVPESVDSNEPLPVIVFLHGFGGPFKAYQWIWKAFAEEHGYAIVSPTFGIGYWWDEAGEDVVVRALAHAAAEAPLDLDRVWLAGLSNGGHGTVYIGTAEADRFEGLILISPGMPSEMMAWPDAPLNVAWKDRPVLLLTGEEDLRMPMAYIDQHVGFMQDGGIDLTVKIYPEEDHFLFFSQPESLLDEIEVWIEATSEAN